MVKECEVPGFEQRRHADSPKYMGLVVKTFEDNTIMNRDNNQVKYLKINKYALSSDNNAWFDPVN